MKVLVFGGAFDPVHPGHVLIAKEAVRQHGFDEVWFTPCFTSRYGKDMASFNNRCKMLYSTLDIHSEFKVCQAEWYGRIGGKMIELATMLEENNPYIDFSYLIGMDSAVNIESWYEWEALIQNHKLVIADRLGPTRYRSPKWAKDHKIVKMNSNESASRLSSTQCRNMIARNGWCEWLSPGAKDLIKERNLYV